MYTIAQNWKKDNVHRMVFPHKAKQSRNTKIFVFSIKKQFMFNINEIKIIGLINMSEKKKINHYDFQD